MSLQSPTCVNSSSVVVSFVEHLIKTDPYYVLSFQVFEAIVKVDREDEGREIFKICVEGDPRLRDEKGR
jgi:hypothetical protein